MKVLLNLGSLGVLAAGVFAAVTSSISFTSADYLLVFMLMAGISQAIG